jgi:hypothetical protein
MLPVPIWVFYWFLLLVASVTLPLPCTATVLNFESSSLNVSFRFEKLCSPGRLGTIDGF